MQPQQYVCKFIEAEVQHILKTESRKVNKAPLETDFCLANGIVDIIMLTDLEDHSQPMRHAYYSPLPIIVHFEKLSDINRNADGTIDQHLMITISIATDYLTEWPGRIQRCTHLIHKGMQFIQNQHPGRILRCTLQTKLGTRLNWGN